jgi:hypothetical protein
VWVVNFASELGGGAVWWARVVSKVENWDLEVWGRCAALACCVVATYILRQSSHALNPKQSRTGLEVDCSVVAWAEQRRFYGVEAEAGGCGSSHLDLGRASQGTRLWDFDLDMASALNIPSKRDFGSELGMEGEKWLSANKGSVGRERRARVAGRERASRSLYELG